MSSIGFVIVSHSRKLAEGVCELAAQVAQGKVRLAPAGGTGDADNPLGTDPYRVLEAIESVYSDAGVVVFMDLGSAVLSSEMALELLDEPRRAKVRLCDAPLVPGAVAAVSQAAAGAGLEEILREARGSGVAVAAAAAGEEREVAIARAHGLHARPAAQFIRLVRRFQARVTLENLTRAAGPVEASSLTGVLALGARQGDRVRLRAEGPHARAALAALAGFLESAHTGPAKPDEQLPGLAASAGIAIGPLVKWDRPAAVPERRAVEDADAECRRLEAALAAAREETRALCEWARAHAGEEQAGIFDAQSLFLEDAELTGSAVRLIREQHVNAGFAWHSAAAGFAARVGALEDPYLRARAADVADVAARVLRALAGAPSAAPALTRPSILAARSLAPSDVKDLDPALVLGLCLETGSASAHSLILARARGIPAVAGLGARLAALADGATVALDGSRGQVWIAPSPEEVRALESRRQAWLAGRRAAHAARQRPAATREGRRIRVLANINGVAEAAAALEYGAEGVGVLRTEFLFLGRHEAPGEDEQFAAYAAIAAVMGERPLVIRTLDAGGDKNVPYLAAEAEANPFLGWRGIRISLARRDLLRTQLRAILRAGAGRAVEVLFPMVAMLSELREARGILGEVETELGLRIKAGIMIETPAAVAVADQLAREADFFSIGTNDLVQYMMAADRTNARVAAMADPFQPAVLRAIHRTIQAGRAAGIGITLCGELAADPLATALLIGMGLEEFSASAPLIPELKQAIAGVCVPDAESLAREALSLDSSAAVRRLLTGPAGG